MASKGLVIVGPAFVIIAIIWLSLMKYDKSSPYLFFNCDEDL